MGVAREMGPLIRLSYNGHLPPEELTKYIFALDKLRACLESAVAIDAAAAAQVKNEPTALTVNIITVPEGYSQQPDGSFGRCRSRSWSIRPSPNSCRDHPKKRSCSLNGVL